MSVADLEIDQLDDAIVTVPLPQEYVARRRRHKAFQITIVVIFLLAYATAFAVYLVDLFSHNFVPEGNYLPLVNATIQILIYVVFSSAMMGFGRRVGLRQREEPSLTIFPLGIALSGHYVSWNQVGPCRWNRYIPETLMVAVHFGHSHARQAVPVPKSHLVLVEYALRRFGKWDQPVTMDDVASETGISIKLRT
jgi:hypothetical protein